jgi:hypothetical protein
MKTEDKNNMPKVRLAVIGKANVGKSGKSLFWIEMVIRGGFCAKNHRHLKGLCQMNRTGLKSNKKLFV